MSSVSQTLTMFQANYDAVAVEDRRYIFQDFLNADKNCLSLVARADIVGLIQRGLTDQHADIREACSKLASLFRGLPEETSSGYC